MAVNRPVDRGSIFLLNQKIAWLDVRWRVFRMKRICQSNDTQQCFGKTLRWSDSLHRQKGVSGVISAQWWLPPPLVGGFLRRNFFYQDWSAYGWGGIRWFEVVNQKSLGKVAELKTLIWLLPFIRGVSWHSAPNGYWRNHWMEDSKLHRKHLSGKWFSSVLIWRCWWPNEKQQGVGGCDFTAPESSECLARMEWSFLLLGETLARIWVRPFLRRNYVLLTPVMVSSSQSIGRSSTRPTTSASLLGSSLCNVLLLSSSTFK